MATPRAWLPPTLISLALVAASLLLQYALFEEFPPFPYYDEVASVPSSRAITTAPESVTKDHPPLVPYLMSLSEAVFGDNPTGWRFPARLCGALILPALFLIGLLLTGSLVGSTIGAVALLSDGLFITLSRAALLETPYVCFGMYALLIALWGERQSGNTLPRVALIISGVLIGLSIACKWSGVFFIAPLTLIYLLSEQTSSIARQLSRIAIAPSIALAVYIGTTCALRTISPHELLNQTLEMMQAHVNFVQPHRYASSAWGWPVLARPIWFGYTKLPYLAEDGTQAVRGTICLGNPAVFLVTGLSMLWLVVVGVRNASQRCLVLAPLVPVVGYLACWLPWIILSSRKGFLYYFFPSLAFACLGLGICCATLYRQGRAGKTACGIVVAVMLGCMIAYLPLYVGAPVSKAQMQRLILKESWW